MKLLINKLMNRSARCRSRSFDQGDGSIVHKREEHVADARWPFDAIMEYPHGGGAGGGSHGIKQEETVKMRMRSIREDKVRWETGNKKSHGGGRINADKKNMLPSVGPKRDQMD